MGTVSVLKMKVLETGPNRVNMLGTTGPYT